MEKVQKYNVTFERTMHHFWCDECGEYLGVTEEYGDGYALYISDIGEFLEFYSSQVLRFYKAFYHVYDFLSATVKTSVADLGKYGYKG